MNDNDISFTDLSDDYIIFSDSASGTLFTYNKTDGSVSEIGVLSETGITDSDPPDTSDSDLSLIIESIDTLNSELLDLQEDLLSSMDRSNELIGALLIVLLAHVTLMIFRKIFGMFS